MSRIRYIFISCLLSVSFIFISLFDMRGQITDNPLGQSLALSLEKRIKNLSNMEEISDSLYNYLQQVGVMMLTDISGDDFKMTNNQGDTISKKNIVGIIKGYDPQLSGEYIVLSAGYDRLSLPGANRNLSGVATLCEIARLISQNKFVFRRSVIIAFFDATELGHAGSWYFVNRSFSEIDNVKFMIDINSVGHSGEKFPFSAFVGVPTASMKNGIEQINNRPFSLQAKIVSNPPFNSNYIDFYDKEIPITLFTSGLSSLDGTRNDSPDLLDYFQISQIVEWIYSYALICANSSEDSMNDLSDLSTDSSGERIYSQFEVEKRATFMKGDERVFLKDWVYKYTVYPQEALLDGTQGKVEVEFLIAKTGEVKNVTIVKSVSPSIDAEVVKVVNASPKWKPATIGGKPVVVKIRIAIDFIATKESGKIGIKW